MKQLPVTSELEANVTSRSAELFGRHQQAIYQRMDRLFAHLMVFQWCAGIAAALWVSPRTWTGAMSETHVHVWAAVLLGGAITSLPVILAFTMPGRPLTRHVIALGQMLTSALLIHLTGGRIETHFHVFGSLALLACYRDTRVLLTATFVVVLDHWLRGVFWPESVYGVVTTSWWRFLEHAGWVVFENVCLWVTVRQSLQEMRNIAGQRAQLETTNELVESEVGRRTNDLHVAMQQLAESNRNLEVVVQELKERNSELDQFNYVASHDLQEPVRKLVSFSNLLEQDLGDELDDVVRQDLHYIVDAAQRMRQLVQDLLALSRTGRSAMKKERLALDQCVNDALQTLQLRIEETGAEIVREPLPEVVGDATMLTQLYQNLIGNALKFTGDQTPVVRLTASRQEDHWLLGVEDNGIGLKPEYAERIFQPFQRLHSRAEYPGTGIGLAICRKTVQRHRGELTVESESGSGARFRFTLPAADGATMARQSDLVADGQLSYS